MSNIRILIVDDQTVVREALVSILSFQSDLKIIGQSEAGQPAIDIARQSQPDIILLDPETPRQDGLETIKKLRLAAPGAKILILTSLADQVRVFQAINNGAIGFILKNARWENLLQAIRDVAKGQSYIDSSIVIQIIQENTLKEALPAKTVQPEFLTEREIQTLRLIAKGFSNQKIAAAFFLQERTVAKYVSNILSKLSLTNRTQAALYVIREGLNKDEELASTNNKPERPNPEPILVISPKISV